VKETTSLIIAAVFTSSEVGAMRAASPPPEGSAAGRNQMQSAVEVNEVGFSNGVFGCSAKLPE